MTILDIAKALETFGPWGVVAVLLFAIGYMYKSTGTLLERRNDQFVQALQNMTIAMNTSAEQGRRVEEILVRVERELEIQRRLEEERRHQQ